MEKNIMGLNPKSVMEKLERVLDAWNTLAPDAKYGGLTPQEYEVFVKAAKAARKEAEKLEKQLKDVLAFRDSCDEVALAKVRLIKNGVLADPEKGENSVLYETMGYVRTDDRKSGLTRKKNLTEKQG
jgi:hypothetical protein